MKAILEFNLPEDKEEYETTMRASSYASVIWELDMTHLRAAIKYGQIPTEVIRELKEEYKNPPLPKEELDKLVCTVLQGVRSLLSNLQEEYQCHQ